MADNEEFVSLDKALNELRLKEEELKRLVSEGEIRAFRDADKMKFKRDDIEKLKQDTGKTIAFQEESSDTLTEDLLFDDEVEDLSLDADEDVGMATAPISSDQTFIDDDPAPAKVTSARKSTGGASGRGSTTSIRRTTGRSTRIRQEEQISKAEISPLFSGVLIVTFLVLVFATFFVFDVVTGEMSPLTEGLATKVNDTMVGR